MDSFKVYIVLIASQCEVKKTKHQLDIDYRNGILTGTAMRSDLL